MRLGDLRRRFTRFLRRSCWPILPLVLGVLGAGLAVQWSIDPDLQLPTGHGIRIAALGICAMAAVLWGAKRWRSWAYLYYGLALSLLMLVLVVGRATNHSRRWIDVAAGFKLQPSEFMKLALILALARWFAERPRPSHLEDVWKPALMALLPAFLVLIEPDLGTALVYGPIFLAMLWFAGLPWRSFRWLLLLPLLLAPMGWFSIQDYQKERILTWWHQEDLSSEAKADEGFHLWHSKMAIGSGGAVGLGWGQGPENRLDRLPERHNDFIFPVFAEEFGFFGASAFLLLYAAMGLSLLAFASRHRDPFLRLTLAGLGVHFLTHLCLNVGVTLGLWPTTGLPLPMVSFGGSSMIVSGLAVGVALVVSAERPALLSSRAFEG